MTWKIATLASQATILYSHALKHYDFINAYGGGWISHLIHPSDAKQSCHNVIQCFRMTTHDVLVGNENIYFSHSIRFFMESLLVGKIKKLPSQAPTYASDEMSTTLDAESEFSEDDEPLIHQVAPKHHIVQHSYFKSPPPVKSTHKTTKNVSQSRKRWVCITYVCTFWAPSFILSSICRMRDKTRQMAWKEKVTLCMLILILNSLLLFLIIGVGQIVCPNSMSASPGEISTRVDVHSPRATVYMYGGYYEIPDIVKDHLYLGYPNSQEMYWSESVLGRDVGAMFPKDEDWATYCPSFPIKPDRFHLFPNGYQGLEDRLWYVHVNRTEELLSLMREKYYKGPVVLDMSFLEGKAEGDPDVRYAVAYDRVYDISGFYGAAYKLQDENFFGQDVKRMFDGVVGGAHLEMTDKFESLKKKSPTQWSKVMACLDGMFFAGYVDHRNDFQCQVTNYILMASSGVLVSVILIKFLAALQLHSARSPEQSDKFVMCLISCYTEGEESLRKTIQSLAGMDYDYRRKLLVLVADGMVTGHGNDRPTPSIILDILGVSEHLRDTKPFVYEAVGEGASQANYALVYSGLFDFEGRSTPYVLIVKVGRMDETILPGNR